jgi:hypothetical protein
MSALQALSREERSVLAEGEVVKFYRCDSYRCDRAHKQGELPLAFFNAMSDKPTLLECDYDGKTIGIPEYMFYDHSLEMLLDLVTKFTDPDIEVKPIESTGDLTFDLRILAAADYYGMASFTQDLFNQVWERFNMTNPEYQDIKCLCKRIGMSPFRERLIHHLAETLAKHCAYEHKRPAYTWVFMDVFDGYYSKYKFEADAAAALLQKETLRRVWEKDAPQEHVAWYVTTNKENASIGELVRQKMRRAGSKYTAQEARYIWKTFGKQVPITNSSRKNDDEYEDHFDENDYEDEYEMY